jgi:hypothetical protein
MKSELKRGSKIIKKSSERILVGTFGLDTSQTWRLVMICSPTSSSWRETVSGRAWLPASLKPVKLLPCIPEVNACLNAPEKSSRRQAF